MRRFAPRDLRLGTSLLVTLGLLLVLLISFTFLTYLSVLNERREAEIDNAVALTRSIASEIDRFVTGLETTTLAVATLLGNEGIPLDQATLSSYLAGIVKEYGFLRALFIVDPSGKVIASASGDGLGQDLSDRPYVRELRRGRPAVWSDALPGLESGQVTVAFGRVIPSRGGAVRGYLVSAFYPVRLMARVQAPLPADAHLALIDRRGVVMHATYEPNLTPELRDLSTYRPVQEALAGTTVRLEHGALPFGSAPRYGAFVPIASTGWVVGIGRPEAPLAGRIREPAIRQAGLLTIAVVVVGVIFGFVARRLTRPLASLADTAAAITRGERPTIPEVSGVVETGQLAAGMRVMAEAVAEREDRLRTALESERASREAAEQAQSRLAFLTEASTVLGSSLEYEEILRNVARLAVPSFADWCAVDVLNDEGVVQRLAVAHVDPAKVELAFDLRRRHPQGRAPSPVAEVLRTGEPLLIPVVTEEELRSSARDGEHLRILRELGLTSAIVTPLLARGQVAGAITFAWGASARRYSEADVALAQDLSARAGVAIDNARMYQRERGIAETLQRSLLRTRLPEYPGVAMASRYLPARQEVEIGGDWYDALVLPDGRIGLVMGDVAGRGIEAAAVMGRLQNAVRAYALEGHYPAETLERVTRLLDIREMATLLYLVFDPATWAVRYANAGHPPPLVLTPDGSVSLLEGGGPPLGATSDVAFREIATPIAPGSTLLLYTDGLIEVRGEALDHGLNRLLRAAAAHGPREPERLLDHLVASMLGAEASSDDVALLAMHAAALDPARLLLQLDAAPPSMPLLRQTLRRWLEQSGVPGPEIFEVSVAASEAFSNAIEHAYSASDARIEVEGRLDGDTLTLTVRDWGQWRPPRGVNRGRGLGLMRGLMDDVSVTPGTDGTLVQMRRRLPRAVPT